MSQLFTFIDPDPRTSFINVIMPRPTRKPKKLASLRSQIEPALAPVMSTPVHTAHLSGNPPESPNLTPIPDNANFPIYEHETVPVQDEFGFSQVRGIKKNVVAMPVVSDSDDDIDDNQPRKAEEEDEELYGVPRNQQRTESPLSSPARPQAPVARPKKPTRPPRTSELLPLLPVRKKRYPARDQQKKMPALRTSDIDSEDDTAAKDGGKKRRVADKENDAPEETSEEEAEVVGRRKIVKQKFAEIDRWEMAFETVDLSFSSQNS